MKIAFINPPFLPRFSRGQRSPGVIKSGTLYYPYWLTYAAGMAEKHGHEIRLIDCPAAGQSAEELLAALLAEPADLIVLETSTPSWETDGLLADRIGQTLPESRICMVGTHVTAQWRQTLQAFAEVDYVAIGEYDLTVTELADALQGDKPALAGIAGLAYRGSAGAQRTAERPLLRDLDQLPWAAPIYQRFLDFDRYYFNLSHHPMIMLIGGRGCTSMCFYCVYPQVMHGHRYRHRSADDLVSELLWVQENLPQIKEITFEDDNFAADPVFARAFAARAIERGVKLPFFANLRTTVDFDTLKALRHAGLRSCAVGFESGDPLLLQNMRKGQNLELQKRFCRYAAELGVLVHGCFMVGFPGETNESMERTLQLAMYLKPDSAQFYPVMPYPGTGAFRYYQENGYLTTENFRDWLTAEGGHQCVIQLPGLPASAIEAFCERAFRRFHFRPRYLFAKLGQALRQPAEGYRSLRAGMHFLRYTLWNHRRHPASTAEKVLPIPPDWRQRIRVPKGRMEEVKKGT